MIIVKIALHFNIVKFVIMVISKIITIIFKNAPNVMIIVLLVNL